MLNCNHCDWTTGSVTLLNRHTKSCHKEAQESKQYKSKRIKCQKWDKKFNKEETYAKHMASVHKEAPKNGAHGIVVPPVRHKE